MRNAWRLAVFDILAPLAAIAALGGIGVVLEWPKWWVAVGTALALLIVQGVLVNFWLLRRDSVSVGTDDDAPGLRLAVVFLATAALCAAVITGYTHWTSKDDDFKRNSAAVVQVATTVAEAISSLSPADPNSTIDKAASMMVPEQATKFKDGFGKTTAELVQRKVTAQAATMAAGVEALGPTAARVAVVMRVTQNEPGKPPSAQPVALLVALTKHGNDWLVQDVVPLSAR